MTNPLISDHHTDTLKNASDALNTLISLMADRHHGLTLLLQPVAAAIEHVAQEIEQ